MLKRALYSWVVFGSLSIAMAGGWFSGEGVSVNTVRCTNLTAAGDATIGDDLVVSNAATVRGTLNAESNVIVNGAITANGSATFNGPFVHNGNVMLVSNLYSYTSIGAAGGIDVADYIVGARLTTTGDVKIIGGGSFRGNAYFLTNFPPDLVQTSDPKYANTLTYESDPIATAPGYVHGVSVQGSASTHYATNYFEGGTNWTALVFTNGAATVTVSRAVYAEILVVGGGGYGKVATSGGGGGAGGLIYTNGTLPAGTNAVVVGCGATSEAAGYDSSFGSIVAKGGSSGMLSGGGSGGGSVEVGGHLAGTPGQGNAGGAGDGTGTSGGGGGAGSAGSDYSGVTGGAGGNGIAYSLSGVSTYYAGGGGGGGLAGGGAGGLGGGGDGGRQTNGLPNGISGTPNTGGGGGSRVSGGSTGYGGSGIVIVRFANYALASGVSVWNSAQIIAAATNTYTIALSGPAVWNAVSNRYDVLPYSTTNYGSNTGSVTITMANNAYLCEVAGTWYYAKVSGLTPAQPVSYNIQYISSSSAVLSACCATNAGDAVPPYYAYFSNLVVYTYDRAMSPLQYTNDAAGIVARCDPLPAGNADARRVVNAASLAAAITAAKPAIAQEAWAYMPSGARQPSLSIVTIDKPLVQQGRVNYIQSGDYFAQSYHGVWDQTITGGVWRIGPNGKTALEITSTNIWLAISTFSVRTNVASFTIETNNVVGTPYIEYCSDLVAAQWLYAAGQSMTDNTTNWTATCPTVATMLFFRAVSPGGNNAIVSHYKHQFNAGLRSTSLQQTTGGWNDLNFPAANIYTFGLADIEHNSPSNGILFKTTCNTNFSSDNVWVTAQLPHSIATNSAAIYPHIHFAQDSATLTGAVFLIRYKRYAPGATIPTAWTDLPTSNVFAYASNTIHQIADTAGISGPFALSELFDFKIWYRGSTGPVLLKFFDLHYQSDGIGSTTLSTKDF